jgi:hypothetical protein
MHLYKVEVYIMDKLCQDIFDNILRYLTIKDIAKIKKVNWKLRFCVFNFENVILSNELNKINVNNINIIEKKQCFYNYIDYILYKFYQNNKNIFKNSSNKTNFTHFFKNKYINNMIMKIFNYYTKNYNLDNYPNIFDLIFVNKFIHMYYFTNKISIESSFDFLSNFNNRNIAKTKFQDVLIDYYSYVLMCLHNNKIVFNTFEKIYDISPYIITVPCLKKILLYKALDLSQTRLLICCNNSECIIENLYEICYTKCVYWDDDLISHNYMEIKKMLYTQYLEYYNILINKETYLINDKIYVKNPMTNRRMRINGSLYKRTMITLSKSTRDVYFNITNFITNKQKLLRKRIFN